MNAPHPCRWKLPCTKCDCAVTGCDCKHPKPSEAGRCGMYTPKPKGEE